MGMFKMSCSHMDRYPLAVPLKKVETNMHDFKVLLKEEFGKLSKCNKVSSVTNGANPNPYRYEILSTLVRGDFLVATIRYPDCTNYEGLKILVFKGISLKELCSLEAIDPHFFDNKYHPIARFVPTEEGAKYAEAFVNSQQ